jgi:hypothetical protein
MRASGILVRFAQREVRKISGSSSLLFAGLARLWRVRLSTRWTSPGGRLFQRPTRPLVRRSRLPLLSCTTGIALRRGLSARGMTPRFAVFPLRLRNILCLYRLIDHHFAGAAVSRHRPGLAARPADHLRHPVRRRCVGRGSLCPGNPCRCKQKHGRRSEGQPAHPSLRKFRHRSQAAPSHQPCQRSVGKRVAATQRSTDGG